MKYRCLKYSRFNQTFLYLYTPRVRIRFFFIGSGSAQYPDLDPIPLLDTGYLGHFIHLYACNCNVQL